MNADKIAVDIVTYPCDPEIDEKSRHWQGCPTVAVTKKGRIFAGWYSGGSTEPDIKNYNILIYSDDGGKTWTKPVLAIKSDREKMIQALDIQLWITPSGKLRVFWVQNDVKLAKEGEKSYFDGLWHCVNDGILFDDYRHAQWFVDCDDPDAETLVFSEPEYLDSGFLRCKPTVLHDGRILYCNYDQLGEFYMFDMAKGENAAPDRMQGGRKKKTPFDETMAYECKDGTLVMFARTKEHYIASTKSFDGGKTWSETVLTDLPNPDSRFYVGRAPSGNLLLVYNDDTDKRTDMTVALSTDDGKTWSVKKLLDDRNELSYPDVDFYEDKIYLVYDRERRGAKEILFTSFTEQQLQSQSFTPEITIISKP